MATVMQELTNRAKKLPEPHRAGAMANVWDAWGDLVFWPDHYEEILADLQRAIEAREDEAYPNETI